MRGKNGKGIYFRLSDLEDFSEVASLCAMKGEEEARHECGRKSPVEGTAWEKALRLEGIWHIYGMGGRPA